MDNTKCFLSNKTDCELVEVPANGVIYYINEEIADEYSLKKLIGMISEQVEKNLKEEQENKNLEDAKKEKAMADLTSAVEALGITQEDLGRLLLKKAGVNIDVPALATAATAPVAAAAPVAAPPVKPKTEEGFSEVDGTLRSEIRASVNAESGVGGGMPAYNSVKNKDGQQITESNKRVKRLKDGALIEKSDFGTTVIRVNQQDPNLSKVLTQVNENHELVRAAVSGSGQASGGQTVDCPLCSGSGITKIGHVTCPKCGGAGMINL